LFAQEITKIRILSLLDGDLEDTFRTFATSVVGLDYDSTNKSAQGGEACRREDDFWSGLDLSGYDVVLLGIARADMERLRHYQAEKDGEDNTAEPGWRKVSAAVVAVHVGGTVQDVELLAQMEFDGILSVPLDEQVVRERLKSAVRRCEQREQLQQRYSKVRQFCQDVNRKRRNLRDKVDLLCKDMIDSNMRFTDTLRTLQRIYDFQSNLTGEFDPRYLLYKALREIKAELTDSSAAMYLCRSGKFEAHVAGAWYEQSEDIAEIEDSLERTVVPEALEKGQSVLVSDVQMWDQISADQRKLLSGLSILAMPVKSDSEILGVTVVYRSMKQGLSSKDVEHLVPLMKPLAQALAAAHKVEHLIG